MSRVRRIEGLIRRYRVDRRLPPAVFATLRSVFRLRVADTVDRVLAALRSTLGAGGTGSGRLGARRVRTAAPLGLSLHDLRHEFATAVTEQLAEAGVDLF